MGTMLVWIVIIVLIPAHLTIRLRIVLFRIFSPSYIKANKKQWHVTKPQKQPYTSMANKPRQQSVL
jgi:hypothetical protein